MFIMDIASYTFQPLSNMATISTTNSTTLGFFFTMPINSTVVANGYWSVSSSGAELQELHSFSPGIYTVVGGDEWGQLVLLHFVVV